ncbi:unnamed protein product [Amoebophrya sp. A120]|nr:unnamed protein product [Amoebophrya sp. A120]|eukprot:GSA120T00021611001.1
MSDVDELLISSSNEEHVKDDAVSGDDRVVEGREAATGADKMSDVDEKEEQYDEDDEPAAGSARKASGATSDVEKESKAADDVVVSAAGQQQDGEEEPARAPRHFPGEIASSSHMSLEKKEMLRRRLEEAKAKRAGQVKKASAGEAGDPKDRKRKTSGAEGQDGERSPRSPESTMRVRGRGRHEKKNKGPVVLKSREQVMRETGKPRPEIIGDEFQGYSFVSAPPPVAPTQQIYSVLPPSLPRDTLIAVTLEDGRKVLTHAGERIPPSELATLPVVITRNKRKKRSKSSSNGEPGDAVVVKKKKNKKAQHSSDDRDEDRNHRMKNDDEDRREDEERPRRSGIVLKKARNRKNSVQRTNGVDAADEDERVKNNQFGRADNRDRRGDHSRGRGGDDNKARRGAGHPHEPSSPAREGGRLRDGYNGSRQGHAATENRSRHGSKHNQDVDVGGGRKHARMRSNSRGAARKPSVKRDEVVPSRNARSKQKARSASEDGDFFRGSSAKPLANHRGRRSRTPANRRGGYSPRGGGRRNNHSRGRRDSRDRGRKGNGYNNRNTVGGYNGGGRNNFRGGNYNNRNNRRGGGDSRGRNHRNNDSRGRGRGRTGGHRSRSRSNKYNNQTRRSPPRVEQRLPPVPRRDFSTFPSAGGAVSLPAGTDNKKPDPAPAQPNVADSTAAPPAANNAETKSPGRTSEKNRRNSRSGSRSRSRSRSSSNSSRSSSSNSSNASGKKHYCVGKRMSLINLQGHKDLNGVKGTVLMKVGIKLRVALDNGREVVVQRRNCGFHSPLPDDVEKEFPGAPAVGAAPDTTTATAAQPPAGESGEAKTGETKVEQASSDDRKDTRTSSSASSPAKDVSIPSKSN